MGHWAVCILTSEQGKGKSVACVSDEAATGVIVAKGGGEAAAAG